MTNERSAPIAGAEGRDSVGGGEAWKPTHRHRTTGVAVRREPEHDVPASGDPAVLAFSDEHDTDAYGLLDEPDFDLCYEPIPDAGPEPTDHEAEALRARVAELEEAGRRVAEYYQLLEVRGDAAAVLAAQMAGAKLLEVLPVAGAPFGSAEVTGAPEDPDPIDWEARAKRAEADAKHHLSMREGAAALLCEVLGDGADEEGETAAIGLLADRLRRAEADVRRHRRNATNAMATVDELRAELEGARRDYEGACGTIARMHAAAVGEVTGPALGVVEDVAASVGARDAMESRLRQLEGRLEDVRTRTERAFRAWRYRRIGNGQTGQEWVDAFMARWDEEVGS